MRDGAMSVRFVKPLVLLLAVLLVAGFLPVLAFAQGDAAGAIASARQQLVVSYGSARAAEEAGANITSLTAVLNSAGDLLSRSELAYSQGNLAEAQALAGQCSQALGSFAAEADGLRTEASQQRGLDFWVNIVGSVVGTFVVVVAGFAVWRFFRSRILPVEVEGEVQADESVGD